MLRACCRILTCLLPPPIFHDYSIKYYKTLEAETGLNAGFSVVGNLRMAQTDARMDEYMVYATTAETCGVPYEWLSAAADQKSGIRW